MQGAKPLVCHMSWKAQRKTDLNFIVNKYRLLSNVKGKGWTNSMSKFRKKLASPGYGHIRLAVGQHVLGYDLRWPYPTIHNLSIVCYQPTKFFIILTRIRRLFDNSQTHRVTFPINLFTPVTQPSSGVYISTPTLRWSSMETVYFPPLSGLYPLLVFGASFLYHLVRQTRTKDVHIRIYNLKPTCWLHYDTAPLKTEAEKKIRWLNNLYKLRPTVTLHWPKHYKFLSEN